MLHIMVFFIKHLENHENRLRLLEVQIGVIPIFPLNVFPLNLEKNMYIQFVHITVFRKNGEIMIR